MIKCFYEAHLQVVPGFRICRTIDAAAEEVVEISSTDDGRNFCLNYHLKGMCNSKCGGRHSHCIMLQGEMGRMTAWRDQFCAEDSDLPVNVVNTDHYGGGSRLVGSVSLQILFLQGGRGRQSQGNCYLTGQPPCKKSICKDTEPTSLDPPP